jgi:carboxymethylenebutenolidase
MRIELAEGTPAELARPGGRREVEPGGGPGEAAGAGLVLCPDIMGLRPLFDALAQRLADENGWVVVAPEPFAGRESMPLEERLGWVGNFDDDAVRATLVAAAEATGADQVGILGFCMGGMWALKGASTGRFRRAVSFYGMVRVPAQWHSTTLGDAIDDVSAPGACPVLELVGDQDPWVSAADIAALEATGAEVVVYPGADHGFVHDPDRPTHRPVDAADAWSRAIAFLSQP